MIDFTNNLAAVFDKHVNYEFEDKDVNATIQTVTKEPYVYHVPVLTGGTGYNEVYTFYSNNFVGKCLLILICTYFKNNR